MWYDKALEINPNNSSVLNNKESALEKIKIKKAYSFNSANGSAGTADVNIQRFERIYLNKSLPVHSYTHYASRLWGINGDNCIWNFMAYLCTRFTNYHRRPHPYCSYCQLLFWDIIRFW
jgi:hypothetical protein